MHAATMDDLIDEILEEYQTRYILDDPIPEDVERNLPRPLSPQAALYRSGHPGPSPCAATSR